MSGKRSFKRSVCSARPSRKLHGGAADESKRERKSEGELEKEQSTG